MILKKITTMEATKKKTLGRRRIEIKKLENKSHKQVTLSKRRAGLFKKAGELSILCGAEVAIIVSTSNDKIFTFAHPSVDSVVDRFLKGSPAEPRPAEEVVRVGEYNREHGEALQELEMENKRLEEAKEEVKKKGGSDSNGCFWWDKSIEFMGLEEMKEHRDALMELRGKVGERIEKMMMARTGGGA